MDIPDAALRKAVEEALGKVPGEPIGRGDGGLASAESESGVRQLAGVELAVNLRELCLVLGAISDLAPLADMALLERLYLYLHANCGRLADRRASVISVAPERPLAADDPWPELEHDLGHCATGGHDAAQKQNTRAGTSRGAATAAFAVPERQSLDVSAAELVRRRRH